MQQKKDIITVIRKHSKDINDIVKKGDAVLVKASRGMEMEEIVKIIIDKQEKK